MIDKIKDNIFKAASVIKNLVDAAGVWVPVLVVIAAVLVVARIWG